MRAHALLPLLGLSCGWLGARQLAPPDDRRCEVKDGYGCFVRIPGGTFQMGAQAADPSAPNHDPDALPEEGPVHEVTVSPFWIMRDEFVTSVHARCVGDGACRDEDSTTGGYSNRGHRDRNGHPMNAITWDGARRACAWAGGRLPTEAEWELAARGVAHQRWPWGDEPGCGVVPTNTSGVQSAMVQSDDRVMTRPPCHTDGTLPGRDVRGQSPFGVRGMGGNVAEWVQDWFGPYPAGPVTDPTGPAEGTLRVLRGGGWTSEDAAELRTTARGAMPPDQMVNDVGFRCVWGTR